MITKTKMCEKTTRRTLGGARWLHLMVLMLFAWLVPQGAWALDTVVLEDKTFYVLRTTEDWNDFCDMTRIDGNVNAIMAADFTVTRICLYFKGIFDGNGHTLNLNISDNDTGVFKYAAKATFKNLHLTGNVEGSLENTGLVSYIQGSTVTISDCWVSATIKGGTVSGFVNNTLSGTPIITNCLFDGKLISTDKSHGAAFVGVVHYSANVTVTNCLEKGTYEGLSGIGICCDAQMPFGAKRGSNNWAYTSGIANDLDTLMNKSELAMKLGGDNWKVLNNQVVPIKACPFEVSFDTYDMVLGTEKGEEGMLKIPFSCDQPVKWIGGTYTDENGATKTISEITFKKNTYAGFIKVPATELHKNMKLNIVLANGYTILGHEVKDDNVMMMHKPENLEATPLLFAKGKPLTDAGAVELTWQVNQTDVADAVDGDQFLIMRSFTGDDTDLQNIGSVVYENGVTNYTFKDSLITSALTAAQIVENLVPLRYVVVRASAKELWGLFYEVNGIKMTNPAMSVGVTMLKNPQLLHVDSYMTSWESETDRTANISWTYATNSENSQVWDSRAQMHLILATTNRAGEPVDTTTYVLTDDEISVCKKIVKLTRSCVNYKVQFRVEQGASPITVVNQSEVVDDYFVINNDADWDTFISKVDSAGGKSAVNARLGADITVTKAVRATYRGTFDGQGHKFNLNLQDLDAPFYSVSIATFTNLHVTGTVSGGQHCAAIIRRIVNMGNVNINHVRVSASITASGSYSGGFIGHFSDDYRTNVSITNCLFDGEIFCNSKIGVFCGWGDGTITFEHNFENGKYSASSAPAMNYRNGSKFICSSTNYSRHDWMELNHANRYLFDQDEAVMLLGIENWHLVDGKAVPRMGSSFYFENLGHIAKQSLATETRPTSVLLTWENETDEPVDYYEVWRKDKNDADFGTKPLATQLTDMQYEDKETSPVHQYIYKVRGVTSCEGLTYDETAEVEGFCQQFGTLEGQLCFLDGTGIPGKKVYISVGNEELTDSTDESGHFRLTNIPYKDGKQTSYGLSVVGIEGIDPVPVTFGTKPGDNVVTGQKIEVGQSVKLSGYVMYDGTSIPVQGVTFLVDGHEVHTAAGKVTSDHEGKFSFRMLKGKHQNIQAVKDGHEFLRSGYYHAKDEDPDTLTTYDINTDVAGYRFYDQTRVKLIGRVVGGNTQGELPLGNALSKNNLGDNVQMVFTLEGDNASKLVFDNQDRNLKERDEVFLHEQANKYDGKHQYQTNVHTTINRMVVSPDPYTGEYEVKLPPVKWKIQQITAKGYATLFQDGQVGDVIDLSDSIVMHRDTLNGEWQTSGDHAKLTTLVEEYQAKYSRIYHSPVLIDYKQQGFSKFDFFGDQYYSFKNLSGSKQKLTLAYGVKKADWPKGKKDSLETRYTFGYPVFSIDRKYPLWISAVEKYYYNNNTKSDTIDVVSLPGGVVTIHNGMQGPLHRDTVHLDSLGQANYVMEIAQKPYLLTGDDALQTMTMTLLQDGTYYEAEPLKGYVFNILQPTGAQDILSCEQPLLLDILRDPPGGSSHATIAKGATLKRAYTMDMEWKAGLEIDLSIGFDFKTNVGIVAAPMGVGAATSQSIDVEVGAETKMNLVLSGSGERAFEYTMTTTEDISTSSDPKLVGADGDLYIGTVQNIEVKPGTAIRAIPDSTFQRSGGELESGRMIEIARGVDHEGYPLHLVRDEVLTYGTTLRSNFVHSQDYIIHQLIPQLTEQCQSLMFTGTKDEAQMQADATGEPVYWSEVSRESTSFGVDYQVIYPKNYSKPFTDQVNQYHESMKGWMEMIARNEKEKLDATDLVANYDVDGGTTVNYSESFENDYSLMNSFVNPFTPITDGYFDNGLANAAVIIGSMAAKLLGLSTGSGFTLSAKGMGANVEVKLSPVASFDVTPKHTESSSYSRTESFSISMDKKSHLSVDVYHAMAQPTQAIPVFDTDDIFLSQDFWQQRAYVNAYLERDFKTSEFTYPRSFVYRTRGGATCRPWEGERKTVFNRAGTVLDVRTKKIENPKIAMDKQSVSGVPFGEAARFKLYLTNESEQPEAAYAYFDLYQVDLKNPDGARLMIDGMPLTGTSRTLEVRPGQVTEKTLEVYAGEKFDYEGLQIGLISQGDIDCYSEVAFDVHYLQTAGDIVILTPGDKWVLNTDAPQEQGKGWYLPVTIGGFDKNQHNFDHIEFQYKESNRGDDYWTNLCGYYADSTIYRAASGTKEMIPVNGNIQTRFFGEGEVMEKGYDLRAVLFCRNGNAFLTNESKVLSGVKDTRRPKLFGSPEPKSGIVGAGDNIVFNFSEDIEYNYLQATTNFEVTGETNETAVQEAPSLQFGGNGYAMTQSRRNFADKNVTVEMMIKPEADTDDMPLFSHGSEGKSLQLWLTKEKRLKAVVGDKELVSDSVLDITGFQRVAMVLDNENRRLTLYADEQIGVNYGKNEKNANKARKYAIFVSEILHQPM